MLQKNMFLSKKPEKTAMRLHIQVIASILCISIFSFAHASEVGLKNKTFNFDQSTVAHAVLSFSPKTQLNFVSTILKGISPRSINMLLLPILNDIQSQTSDIMTTAIEKNLQEEEKECHNYKSQHHRLPQAKYADAQAACKRHNIAISPEPSPATKTLQRRNSMYCTPKGSAILFSPTTMALRSLRAKQSHQTAHNDYNSPTPTPKAAPSDAKDAKKRESTYDAYDFGEPPMLTLPVQKFTPKVVDKAESAT